MQNEYISIMEKCKSKKLLWRVNKSYARELLPKDPLPVQVLPWHIMSVANMGAHPNNTACPLTSALQAALPLTNHLSIQLTPSYSQAAFAKLTVFWPAVQLRLTLRS